MIEKMVQAITKKSKRFSIETFSKITQTKKVNKTVPHGTVLLIL